MKPQLSMTLFRRLSTDIVRRPCWALFTANEYLDRDHPLRLALIRRVTQTEADNRLLQAAIAGERLGEVTSELGASFREERERSSGGRKRRAPLLSREQLNTRATLRARGQQTKAPLVRKAERRRAGNG